MPVVIVGKAYENLSAYEAGSSSMLVGHYVEDAGVELYYYDEVVGEIPEKVKQTAVFYLHTILVLMVNNLTLLKAGTMVNTL